MRRAAPNERPEEPAKELFLDAVELPLPERAAFLAQACAGRPELAARVQRLLAAHEHASLALGDDLSALSVLPGLSPFADEVRPGTAVGAYRLLQPLGAGGFGEVWMAEQERPVRRRVALKLLKPGMDTREVVARFEAERQALALMDHPGIARVFDAGATARGRPWFAMELVPGRPITHYCEARGLGLRERLRLFVSVCQAVQHAHQKGVVHRDIKPGNVLVAELDGRPLAKVIDFGVAKAIGSPLTEHSLRTRGGQVLGTPAYMSPEQVEGARDVDTRADVYALGALLYELLSGSLPFDDAEPSAGPGAGDDRGSDVVEVLRRIREEEPPRPSTRLARTSVPGARRRIHPRHLRGDLDWIVLRCLEKDRARRYDSVAVLAQDIERHLQGQTVLAGPPDLSYRLRKFVRRHAAALSVAAAIVLLLAGATVVSTRQARRARTELARYQQVAVFLEHALLSLDPQVAQGKDPALLLEVLERFHGRLRDDPDLLPEVEATLRRVLGGAYMKLARYDEAEPQLAAALELRRRARGPLHPETLQSEMELGGLLLERERWDEAEPHVVRGYEGRRELHGPGHPDTLEALANVATLRHRQGRLDEAERLFRELEARRLESLGERHPDTVRAMSNLAAVQEDLGRTEEALQRYRRALELQLALQGETHPETLKALNNLGTTLQSLGQWEEAAALLERALEIKRRILPADHPSILVGLNNLAQVRKEQGRHEQAVALYREALPLAGRLYGADGQHSLIVRYNLAALLSAMGRFGEAEPELSAVAAAARRTLGESAQLTLSAEMSLAEAMAHLGRGEQALVLAATAAERGQHAFPPAHATPGILRARYGLLLHEQGQAEQAVAVLEDSLRLMQGTAAGEWPQRARQALEQLRAPQPPAD